MPESTLDLMIPSPLINAGAPQAQPTRQPVMLKVFEQEWNSIAMSRASGNSRIDSARPSKAISAVGHILSNQHVVLFGPGNRFGVERFGGEFAGRAVGV